MSEKKKHPPITFTLNVTEPVMKDGFTFEPKTEPQSPDGSAASEPEKGEKPCQ